MVSLMIILFRTKWFLFVYTYIYLLKLKAYKLFENSGADFSWLLFKEANLLSAFLVEDRRVCTAQGDGMMSTFLNATSTGCDIERREWAEFYNSIINTPPHTHTHTPHVLSARGVGDATLS